MARQSVRVSRTIDMVIHEVLIVIFLLLVDDNIVIELVKNQIKNCEKEN